MRKWPASPRATQDRENPVSMRQQLQGFRSQRVISYPLADRIVDALHIAWTLGLPIIHDYWNSHCPRYGVITVCRDVQSRSSCAISNMRQKV